MDIIFFGYDGWSPWERRPQLLARALANAGCRVLYVEPGPPFKSLLLNGLREPRDLISGSLRNIQQNLWLLTCGFRWSLDKSIIGHEVSMKFFELYCRQASRSLGFKDIIIGYQSPLSHPFVGFENKLIFYDCIDDWRNFPGIPTSIASHVEDTVLRRSDLVFASSKQLVDILRERSGREAFYLPNALGSAFMGKGRHIESKLTAFDGITLGFVGGIGGDHFDWDLLTGLLEKKRLAGRHFRVVLVGPLIGRTNITRGQELKRSGLILIGKVPYSHVTEYMVDFDFCILPWKVTELVRGVDPIKIYEYLASGKPVISTYWAELEKFRSHVYFASTPNGYEYSVQKELDKPLAQRNEGRMNRQMLVIPETWERRASVMTDHLLRALSGRV